MVDKRLFNVAKQYGKVLAAIIGLSVLVGLLVVIQADYLARVINGVFLEGKKLTDVTDWLVLLAGIMLGRAIIVWGGERVAHRLADGVKTALRTEVISSILAAGPVGMSTQQTGEIINIITEGIESLEPYFVRYLPQLATAVFVPLLVVSFVVPLDLTVAAILLITAPLIPLFMVLIGRLAERRNRKQWETLSRLSAHFMDVLQGLTTLKLFGRSLEQIQVVYRVSDEFRSATLDVLKIAFLSALVLELLATISTALVAVTVGLKLLFYKMDFYQALFILLLVPEFYLPLRNLGSQFHAGMSGAVAAERIFQVLALPAVQAIGGEKSIAATQRGVAITFNDVGFVYPGSDRPALEQFSLSIAAGKRVALVGASGAGKSTVASLLMGFIKPTMGTILINGQPLSEIKRSEWLAQVAYVPQRPHLFNASVIDNIRLGCPTATLEEVIAAARLAGAEGFISMLPSSFDTRIGDGGHGLSGGEGQRIAIARAFLKAAPVLVLDEATAGLDPETEAVIQEALVRLMQGRTTIVIAHRLTTVYEADHIVVMERGRPMEMGSHEALLTHEGLYCNLVAAYRGTV